MPASLVVGCSSFHYGDRIDILHLGEDLLPIQIARISRKQIAIGENCKQSVTGLSESLNHMMTPGDIQTDGGELPGAAAIASLLDAATAAIQICRAQNHMVGINWVQPGGAAIAVPVEVLPGRPAVG